MAFNPDPFLQAEAEVANKSIGSQVAHSGIFHSVRSAFSSKGSAASKGIGVVMGVGKIFLSLIPVPVVGAVVGATVDAISGKVRAAKHEHSLSKATTNADKAKFILKELTVENLDRYRWKVAHAYEELNSAITAYNASNQTCDDLYAYALLYEQVERRKQRLRDEFKTFTDALAVVESWMTDLETSTGGLLLSVTNSVRQKALESAQRVANAPMLKPPGSSIKTVSEVIAEEHSTCKLWCCGKEEARYNPSVGAGKAKAFAGKAAQFLLPIAASSVAVKQSDYTSDSANSQFSS